MGHLFPIVFLLLLWIGSSFEENVQLSSPYWEYLTLNGTSPFLLHSVGINDGISLKQGNRFKGPELISFHLQWAQPPFVVTVGNQKCIKDSQTFLKNLNKLNLWALKMYDSTAKLPSGLLNGNVNQFGDFDQCLSVNEPSLHIKGQYCLAYMQVRLVNGHQEDALKVLKLMQSHFLFRSKLTDPGHRVPRFSTINWGLCMPSSCTPADVESQLKATIDYYTNGTGFDIEVAIDPEMCQQKETFKVSIPFFIVSFLFLAIIVFAITATLKDFFAPETSSDFSLSSFLNCFSMKRNVKALLSLSRSSDDIQSVHGIRMFNSAMLVLCHKSMALFFVPYSNRTLMVEKLSQPWCIIARIASLYTDTFVMISGLLTSYSLLKTLQKSGKLDLKNEYISRLIRIIPPLTAVMLLSTFILPELGSGPQWNLTVAHHAEKCKKTWWKNFLFIHNYLGFENMCLTHTHHLGIDTQLFFISPFLIYFLYKWPVWGVSGLMGLAGVSTMARFQTTTEKNLSFFIYPGISVSQMFDTANYSYIIPFHRLTCYVIGILLGYALRYYGSNYKLKSNVLRIGWTLTFSFLSYILTKASEMNHRGYVYDNKEAATYAALGPIAWCLFWGWLIFISQNGCGGFLGKLMSSKYCLIWTRLSYAVYLTQFPVFFFNVGLQKYSQQYSIFLLVNVLEYGAVLLSSVALTLLFDMPFGNLKKILIKKS